VEEKKRKAATLVLDKARSAAQAARAKLRRLVRQHPMPKGEPDADSAPGHETDAPAPAHDAAAPAWRKRVRQTVGFLRATARKVWHSPATQRLLKRLERLARAVGRAVAKARRDGRRALRKKDVPTRLRALRFKGRVLWRKLTRAKHQPTERDAAAEPSPAPAPETSGDADGPAPGPPMLRGGRSLIGVDMGLRSLKVVHLLVGNGRKLLIDAATFDLPPESDPTRSQAASGFVRQVLRQAQPRVRSVRCVLSGADAPTLCCSMPPMPAKELAQALRWKLAEAGLEEADQTALGHYTAGEPVGGNAPLVAAAARPGLGGVEALFTSGRPHLSTVVSGPLAAEDLVLIACPEQTRGDIAVLDIGSASSRLSVTGPEGLEFIRDIPVGSESLTAALAGRVTLDGSTLDVTREAAEEIKRGYTIGQSGTVEAGGVALPANRVLSAIRPVLERLASEVVRSMQFHAQARPAARVDALWLVGGGAMLGGLPEYLTREVRVQTERLDPWQRTGIEVPDGLAADPAVFALATGAAIHDRSKINLLPSHLRARRLVAIAQKASFAGAALVAVALLVLSWTAGRQKARMNGILGLKQQTAAPMERLAEHVEEAQFYKRELGRRMELLNTMGVGRPVHAAVLKELSNIMPEGTYLRALSFGETKGVDTMHLSVDLYTMPTTNIVHLKQGLIAAIEESPFFVNVSFAPASYDRTEPRAPDAILSLTCQVLGFPGG